MLSACSILALPAGASMANAHGYVYSWTIDGETHRGFNPDGQEDYTGAERPTDNSQAKGNGWGPASRNTGQVACGGNDAGSGLESWAIKGGSTVVVEWSDPKNGETVWPPAHVGPMSAYMAKCPDTTCDGVPADSLSWFKIDQTTYDGTQWPAEKITAGEDYTFTIPSDLAPGAYLLRHEIIALHFAWDESAGEGFENYPYCIQTILSGDGTAVPADTATFPAVYDPANYEWYDYSVPWDPRDPNDYVPPGPAVYTGGGSSAPAGAANATASGVASGIAPPTGSSSASPAPMPSSGGGSQVVPPTGPDDGAEGDQNDEGATGEGTDEDENDEEPATPSRTIGNELAVEPTGTENDADGHESARPTPPAADDSASEEDEPDTSEASSTRRQGGWGSRPTGSSGNETSCSKPARPTGTTSGRGGDDDDDGDEVADASEGAGRPAREDGEEDSADDEDEGGDTVGRGGDTAESQSEDEDGDDEAEWANGEEDEEQGADKDEDDDEDDDEDEDEAGAGSGDGNTNEDGEYGNGQDHEAESENDEDEGENEGPEGEDDETEDEESLRRRNAVIQRYAAGRHLF